MANVDTRKIPTQELLEYNLRDTAATFYVYNKYKPKLISENQQEIYEGIFKDSVHLILHLELAGMVMDMAQVLRTEKELSEIQQAHLNDVLNNIHVKDATEFLHQKEVDSKNSKLKKLRKTKEDVPFDFNPNSNVQLQYLIYTQMQLPVLDKTFNGQPATGAKALDKLKQHTSDESKRNLLDALVGLNKVSKILSAFIPAFKKAVDVGDGTHRLYGNFNPTGTQSFRLSSNSPNLQQIPSGSTYAKIIKKCFIAEKGFIFSGSDFNALEARVGALLTKDPQKLKVYTDGYDSHCLNSLAYFGDQMEGIDPDDVESVNSIAVRYPALRQASKGITFAAQYFGTYKTFMDNSGLDEYTAKQVESNYHKLYQVSDKWAEDRLKIAERTGYVTGAFGLKIRTPILLQTITGSRGTPQEAEAEKRSAGNAMTQSYCVLNSRSSAEFLHRVLQSKYVNDIRLSALVHDALYLYIRDDFDVIAWVNKNLAECMEWQDLPELQHNSVGLGGELDLQHPNWASVFTIPNHATADEIKQICIDEAQKRKG